MFGLISKKKLKSLLDEKDKEIQHLLDEINKRDSSSIKVSPKCDSQNRTEIKNQEVLVSNDISKENETLKKKLNSAENEIDDLEDELSEEKKRYQQKREEFLLLQEKYQEIEKENNENKKRVEKSEKKLTEQTDKILLKDSSLAFVQEILNAPEVSSNRGDDIYSKIDSVVDYVLGDYRDCVNDFFGKDKERDSYLFNNGLLYWAAIEKKTWLKNKKTIAFVGEFSAGKTSIVNKILAQGKDSIILPVSTKATTAIPTYISGSKTNTSSYSFLTPDNKLKIISEETFKKVDKGILAEVDGISRLIKYFVMSCSNNNLQDLSILDTPGFTSNDNDDAIRTIDVINECDALFWVFDVNVGTVNKSSLKIIKENLQKPLFVIINKVDTKSPNQVDKVEKLIRDTFKKEKIVIQDYIRYSYNEEPDKILDVLQKIPRTNDTSDFIALLQENSHKLLTKLENECTKWGNEKAAAEIRVDENRDSINTALGNVCDICVDINDIIVGSYTEHIFKSDKYELSSNDYERITRKFKRLIEYEGSQAEPDVMNSLIEAIDNYANAVKDRYYANEKYAEVREQKNRFENCVKQLNKRISALKK